MHGTQGVVCDGCQLNSSQMEKPSRNSQPNTSLALARVTALSRIHHALVDHFTCSTWTLCWFLHPSPFSLPHTILTSLSVFPPASVFLYTRKWLVLSLKVSKAFCKQLWWMQERVCRMNFIFEIQRLCSILLVEVWNTVESLHKMYILSDDPVAVSNTAEHFKENCLHHCHSPKSLTIDLLPNYGPGTSKRYRKPVTTDNTVISNCEKRNFRCSSDLAEAKIYLFAVLVIFDMPSTNHFFWPFYSQVGITMVLEGFLGCLWQRFRRLGPLKIGLVILGNLRKC